MKINISISYEFFLLNLLRLIQIQMSTQQSNIYKKLTVNNYKSIMKKLMKPHQQKINQSAQHLKQTIIQYRSVSIPRNSYHTEHQIQKRSQRSPSNLSDYSGTLQPSDRLEKDQILIRQSQAKPTQLLQWRPATKPSFSHINLVNAHYSQLFVKKTYIKKNSKDFYDFKIDEKQMLIKIFQQIKTEPKTISFQSVQAFFQSCKLFYLCYNIKPTNLLDVIKDSARTYNNKLTKIQFLNIFFIDRPNLTCLYDNQSIKIAKMCVLSEQNWKELKGIFSTLDTFGNQTIFMAPFLYKIKNNHSNRQLINEPTIEYLQIGRTIPLKKIIFNLENRYKFTEKITWPQIQEIIGNFRFISEPTIDEIYKKNIQNGIISKFSNYFMIGEEVIEEIKHIFQRCPKYCEYFIKTNFFCGELLQSNKIKKQLKETIVRIIQMGGKSIYTNLQDQIRMIAKNAQKYIDLDQLLEYFSIKGPINTTADHHASFSSEQSDEQQQNRVHKLRQIRSADKIQNLKKIIRHPKAVRHLTVCQQFKLSQKNKQTIMQKKTKEWKQSQQKQLQQQLNRKFKASPIPAQLNAERYQQYLKKRQEIKQLKKQQFFKKKQDDNQIYQYLKSNTKLFENKSRTQTEVQQQLYKFTPKPIPWHIVEFDLLKIINDQKNKRRKQITIQNRIKILRQWRKLPDVMLNYQQLNGKSTDRKQQYQSQVKEEEQEVKQKQRKRIREVPDFKKLHAQFQQELSKKKAKFTPTVPVAPKFTSIKPRKLEPEKQVKKIGKSVPRNSCEASAKHKTSVQTYIVKQQYQIPTTKKYTDMVEYIQGRLRNKQQQQQRKRTEQIQKVMKQLDFQKLVQKRLKKSQNHNESATNLHRQQRYKINQQWRSLQKKNQQEYFSMYTRVMARPFLFQKSKINQPQENNQNHQTQKKKKLNKKKRNKPYNWKREGDTKHVHQSPLKNIEAEQQSPHQQQGKPNTKAYFKQQEQQSQNSEQNSRRAYLLNQSY